MESKILSAPPFVRFYFVINIWYALRIEKMIEENKLIVVDEKDPSHPYGKVLRKVL
jgi:hypothetical protein